jgi:hypothetical protein
VGPAVEGACEDARATGRGADAAGASPSEAPVPGWAGIVALARTAAGASEPAGAFACEARHGRLAWRDVRGPAPFVDLLWILEELSAAMCELCGAPARPRPTWDGHLRTLCPRHAVAVVAAGPRVAEVYDAAWAALAPTGRDACQGADTRPDAAAGRSSGR